MLPDSYSVLGGQIHAIALGDAVEIQEFIKLLQSAVDAQIVHGMNIVYPPIGILERVLRKKSVGICAIEFVIIKVFFRRRNPA